MRNRTPGKWTVARSAYVDMSNVDKITVVSESARQVVCKVGDSNHPAVLADAALIARAPELAAEVERLTTVLAEVTVLCAKRNVEAAGLFWKIKAVVDVYNDTKEGH